MLNTFILFLSLSFFTCLGAKLKEGVVPKEYNYLAPDGSEIRLLPEMKGGGIAHCTLPVRGISQAIKHETVEEIWFFLEGSGEVWRKLGGEEKISKVSPGLSITIPPGTHFQFRNTGNSKLKFLIVCMPPWPGPFEATKVDNFWSLDQISLQKNSFLEIEGD